MANYIDLVLVEDSETGRRTVCRAPWMSHIEVGTKVRCEVPNKKNMKFSGEVVATTDIEKNDEDLNFILECTGQKGMGLPKVMSKLKIIEFDYEDEDDAED